MPAKNEMRNPTIWKELDNSFIILDVDMSSNFHKNRGVDVDKKANIDNASIRIRHPELKRPRYFVKSKSGNWYSRYTPQGQQQAEGFIIKDVEHFELLALDWLSRNQGDRRVKIHA